jgi:hypothetical protein
MDIALTQNQDELKAFLLKQTEGRYAPYTLKMLKHDPKIILDDELPDDVAATLVTDERDGKFREIRANPTPDAYAFAVAMEHEGSHFEDILCAPKYNSMHTARPQDFFKILQIKEYKAYSGEIYKMIVDYAHDAAPRDSIAHTLSYDSPIIYEFLEAHAQHEIEHTAEAAMAELDAVKKAGAVRALNDVLPDAYYRYSKNDHITTHFKHAALGQQHAAWCYLTHCSPAKRIETINSVKRGLGVESLYSENFTLQNAQELAACDGFDPIGAMDEEKRGEFWRGLCYLNSEQSAVINGFKQQGQRLRLIQP